ncbi:hypothetical protein DXG03_001876 [Asterophora parasitica]|uniref:Uncharacterized protein n=1 Tax=Asterophora parasitica TaxID=117018 RepID=A0A9P7G900_9AGAR|nr:hypothetical protein DXG03_001876 [Asterophora parasitica]
MPQDSVYKGTSELLHEFAITDILPDRNCSVTPQDAFHPTSYDLGPDRVVAPGAPPVWRPQHLPIVIPADEPAADPRNVLSSCPLDALLRALKITSPDLSLDQFDLVTDRKNLRALLSFFRPQNQESHRIDAELFQGTLLFYLGWSAWGYSDPQWNTYGVNFERRFTSPLSNGAIQHNRVIAYGFGGLNVMVKYQVDACLPASWKASPMVAVHEHSTPAFTTPTGLHVIQSGRKVSSEKIVEIKTCRPNRKGLHWISPRSLPQLWFSQTPLLITGYHDGAGRFSSIMGINVMQSGALKQWEGEHTLALQKVVRLIEMIKEHLTRSPIKRQAIVLEKGGFVKFYSLDGVYDTGLPADLRQVWAKT